MFGASGTHAIDHTIVETFEIQKAVMGKRTLLLPLFVGTKFSDFATLVLSMPQLFSSNEGLLQVSYNTMKY